MAAIADMFEGIDPGAQSAIRSYCGWHVAPVITEEMVLDGTGTRAFSLKSLRLLEVLSLSVDGTPVSLPVEFSRAGIIRHPTPDKFGAIALTVRHGFSQDELADLVAIVPNLRRLLKLQGGNVRIGQVQYTPGAMNLGGLDPYSASVLDRFALPFKAGVS